MTRKRHSPDEIISKLLEAREMMQKGRRQDEIARALGISVMTFHRWRKARPDIVSGARPEGRLPLSPAHVQRTVHDIVRLDELRIENDRLRRLVTNLLLEKIRLEEALEGRSPVGGREDDPSH